MAGSIRHPKLPKLPVQRGLLRITGETLQGPRESDWFDIVSAPGGDVGVVLLDLTTRHPSPADVGGVLLAKAARSFGDRAPLHVIALDLARALFEYPGSELRVTLVRCSTASARVELATAGMPPLACAHPDGHVSIHGHSSPPLTSTTLIPPPVEVVPLVWGTSWLAVSDGFTAGSDHPDLVRRLALDLRLPERGLSLSGESADALYELLAARVAELGRFTRDDATLVLIGADPHARFESGFQRS